MKVCVIQPAYSFDEKDVQTCFAGLLDLLEKCDDSMDLIVLPEYRPLPTCRVRRASTARRYFEMGIDTVLTNDYLAVENAVKDYLPK